MIKVGQIYTIHNVDDTCLDNYTEGESFEVVWVDPEMNGRDTDGCAIDPTWINDGWISLYKDVPENNELEKLVDAVFDDIISNHIKNEYIASMIVDTFNYDLRKEFVKRVFDLEDV